MPEYRFIDYAEDVLKGTSKPLTYQEIWELGIDLGIKEKLKTEGKSPWHTLGARLYVEVRDNPDSKFIKVGRNPARFYLKKREKELTPEIIEKLIKDEVEPESPKKSLLKFNERELHPLIAYYVYSNPTFNRGRRIYSKTIHHEKSRHNTLSEWTYPDMVGFYIPIEDWENKLIELNKNVDKSAIRFYSFEIKKEITRSNYREYFFQAVSNSSWSHEGYVVAVKIEQRDDLLAELERLSNTFGIGIISISLDDIDSSEILFPARRRNSLDWELMNKLCSQNRDFLSFIDNVRIDFESNRIHASEYDKIISEPEIYIEEIKLK